MDRLLLRIDIKKENLKLESRSLMGQCKLIFYQLFWCIFFVFYIIYSAILWTTGVHRLSIFIAKKKNFRLLKNLGYDHLH